MGFRFRRATRTVEHEEFQITDHYQARVVEELANSSNDLLVLSNHNETYNKIIFDHGKNSTSSKTKQDGKKFIKY